MKRGAGIMLHVGITQVAMGPEYLWRYRRAVPRQVGRGSTQDQAHGGDALSDQ